MYIAVLAKDADWRTRTIWRCEFTSATIRMIRSRLLGEAEALTAIIRATGEMSLREHLVPQPRALAVALRDGISAYDAQYIALAEILGLRCVTADAPLVRRSPMTSVLLTDFPR